MTNGYHFVMRFNQHNTEGLSYIPVLLEKETRDKIMMIMENIRIQPKLQA